MKVLIVDDHAIFRRMIRSMLDRNLESPEIFEAANGEEALILIKAHADLDFLLTDYNMPTMNGLQMLEALRRDFPTFRPKVLFVSSERDPALIERAAALGVSQWLRKPIKREDLAAAMSKTT